MKEKGKTYRWILQNIHHQGDECLIWPFGRDGQGYARAFHFSHKTRLAHRIMCELAHGKPTKPCLIARHTCGQGHMGCVNPNHLAWGTSKENALDMYSHGTMPLGVDRPRTKLSENDVYVIRSLIADGRSLRKIASSFGVSASAVQCIKEKRSWRHLGEPA